MKERRKKRKNIIKRKLMNNRKSMTRRKYLKIFIEMWKMSSKLYFNMFENIFFSLA